MKPIVYRAVNVRWAVLLNRTKQCVRKELNRISKWSHTRSWGELKATVSLSVVCIQIQTTGGRGSYPRVRLDDGLEWVESTAAPNKKGQGQLYFLGMLIPLFVPMRFRCSGTSSVHFNSQRTCSRPGKQKNKHCNWMLQTHRQSVSLSFMLTRAVEGGMRAGDTNKLVGWLSVWRWLLDNTSLHLYWGFNIRSWGEKTAPSLILQFTTNWGKLIKR